MTEIWRYRINTIPNDGLIRYFWIFNGERLLLTSPAALADVLVHNNYDFHKPDFVRWSLGRLLGDGIILSEDDAHKIQRRKLLPAFAFRHIKDLHPMFWTKSQEVVRAMTRHIVENAESGPTEQGENTAIIEMSSWSSRVALDIIGIAGLGQDFGAIHDPSNKLSQTYKYLFTPSAQQRMLNLLSIFLGWFIQVLPFQRNREMEESTRFIRATCAELIWEKKQKLAQKELDNLDILSVAIGSGGFTDENLVDQLMTFLAAGHETTASATTWCMYLLAKHPQVQTRLRAEIRGVLQPISKADQYDSAASSIGIDRMPYLNAVINETLRYFSPVVMTLRVAIRDTTIQGQFVPKGTTVVVMPWAVNKSESMWGPDARLFNPDRWMPKYEGDRKGASGGATSKYAFISFLHGPRSCIGQGFARAELACLIACLVGRFSFELANKEDADEAKLNLRGGIAARPAEGMYLRTTVVEGW